METNNIQKPVSVVIEEATEIIANAINSVQLHPTLLEMVLKDIYLDVKNQAVIIAEKEKNAYLNSLIEKKKDETQCTESDNTEVIAE